jgi:hypothetical protein
MTWLYSFAFRNDDQVIRLKRASERERERERPIDIIQDLCPPLWLTKVWQPAQPAQQPAVESSSICGGTIVRPAHSLFLAPMTMGILFFFFFFQKRKR